MTKSHDDPRLMVDYGQEVLDWGASAVPRVILRFYRHLTSGGERLDDREMMPLVLLLALWEDGERELRLSNLPSSTPVDTLERRYLRKWRRMGLVFTRRVYYSQEEMIAHYGSEARLPDTPRLKARVFDLSSLVYNCVRVARLWREAYPAERARWEEQARQGSRARAPHPHIPSADFTVEVELPDRVAACIAGGGGDDGEGYQFVPEKWATRARDLVPAQIVPVRSRTGTNRARTQPRTGTDRAGTDPRTGTNRAGTDPRTGTNRAGQLELFPYGKSYTPGVPGGPPGGGPAGAPAPIHDSTGSITDAGNAAGGEESLAKATTAPAVNAGGRPRGPAGRVPARRATPVRPPAGPRQAPPLTPEPLPQRRRRVLDDLRRARNRRQRVAIVTANVGQVLGLGLEPDGSLRATPAKGDYARIGGMMKQYGDERLWIAACRVAGHAIEGDPLDYFDACLREENARNARGRKGVHNARGTYNYSVRDGYPTDPDGYGNGYEV